MDAGEGRMLITGGYSAGSAMIKVEKKQDGRVRWKTGEDPLFNKGGSILVDGLLLSTDRNKMLYVIQPDPSGFKPLASVELLEQGENWAPLALVDGKLLIRDQKQLKCVKVIQ